MKLERVIDQVCDEFELAWQQGQPVSIEEALERSAIGDRDGLLYQLIRLEVGLQQASSQSVSPDDYRRRFPDKASIVESAFSASHNLDITMKLPASQIEVTTDLSNDSPTVPNSSGASSATGGQPRKSIGRYTILGILGRGGQADVFRGVHPTLPIEVAIKLTHETLSEKAREALKEEAHILCDLDHPHIARIRDFDFDDGRPFMVLDFIRGRSLGQIAESQPLSPTDAAELVAKLARAIDYAHARGVIHRDLKPDNVVIDESGEPKIIDFGMSRIRSGIAGAVEQADEVSGTLAYMSPEQAAGITSRTDHRVDVFALGAILYRLLVGKSPYPPMPVTQLLQRVRQGEWDRDALNSVVVAEPLKAICCRAMASEPNERFGNASELATALDGSVVDRHALAVAPSNMAPSNDSKAWLSRLVVVGVLTALAGFAYLATRPSTLQPSPVSSNSSPANTESIASGQLIKRFELIHIGNSTDKAEFSGSLMQFRPPRELDDIQVVAEFTEPVYCFLFAMNPDGVKQLCYPSDPDQTQSEPITQLRYPEQENTAFGLTDGAGEQAFVLFTSQEPLPSYAKWNATLSDTQWPNPEVTGNWSYHSGELAALAFPSAQRGTRGEVRTTKTPTHSKSFAIAYGRPKPPTFEA